MLILGLSYKPGVGDVRTSAIGGTISKLESYGVDVVGYDPYADPDEVKEEFGIDVRDELSVGGLDGIVLATPYRELTELDYLAIGKQMGNRPLIVDVDGVLDAARLAREEVIYKRL